MFSEVVALDAWHSPVKKTRDSIEVYVDLAFKDGRMGGEDIDFPFTFRVALKRAKLVLKAPEPLSIIRKTIARDIPLVEAERTQIKMVRDEIISSKEGELALNAHNFAARLSASKSKNSASSKADVLKVVQTIPLIMVAGEPQGSNAHTWSFQPTYSSFLSGSPWDPIANPRFSGRYDYKNYMKNEPVINASITCALEDLIVSDIEMKNKNLSNSIKNLTGYEKRMAAARQHIKQLLHRINLEPGRMDNRFASLLIASAIAVEEMD
tara:strand:+ start:331 stop:1128 length:798 start_codon:yes stop_codon:yes gene_type:complete